MKHRKVMYGTFGGFLTLVSSLYAGVTISTTHATAARPNDKAVNKTYIDSDRLRLESQALGGNQIVIFRQDKSLFWMIDPKAATYMEITKEDLQKMKAKLDEAKSMMDEQTKGLSTEQKQMMEKMMKGRMPMMQQAAGASKATYKKVASGEKVSQWVCAKYAV